MSTSISLVNAAATAAAARAMNNDERRWHADAKMLDAVQRWRRGRKYYWRLEKLEVGGVDWGDGGTEERYWESDGRESERAVGWDERRGSVYR